MKELTVIFGASSSIGRETVKLLLQKQQQVIGTHHVNNSEMEGLQNGRPGGYQAFQLNILDTESIDRFIQNVLAAIVERENFTLLNIIYCCGAWHTGRIAQWTNAEIDKTFGINVKGPAYLSSSLLKYCSASFQFIFITGLSNVRNPVSSNILYGMCTNSLDYFVRGLNKELMSYKKSYAVAISLGLFDKGQDYYQELSSDLNLNQKNTVQDVAAFISLLIMNKEIVPLISGSVIDIENNVPCYGPIVEWFNKKNEKQFAKS